MTVSTEISSNEYTGNGVTTDFDYKFRIFKANQLSVITSDADGDNVVTLRLGTDYTVTGANKSAGGKVILTKPLANGHKISIYRDIPITQETSFRNQSKFFAETHEDAFDYLTMILQRVWGSLGSLYLKRPNILANWFDAKGYRIANLGKPKRDSDAVDLGTLKDEISGVNSTILKREKRLLRVDDMDVSAFPKASERKNKQVGFDATGNPTLLDPIDSGALGYVLVDSFEKGALITGRFQALFWEEKKEYFRWDGSLNKVVPPNSNPNETGGIKTDLNPNGLWVSVGSNSLINQRIFSTKLTGIGLTDFVSIKDYLSSVDGSTNNTNGIKNAYNDIGNNGIYWPEGHYIITDTIDFSKSSHFDGVVTIEMRSPVDAIHISNSGISVTGDKPKVTYNVPNPVESIDAFLLTVRAIENVVERVSIDQFVLEGQDYKNHGFRIIADGSSTSQNKHVSFCEVGTLWIKGCDKGIDLTAAPRSSIGYTNWVTANTINNAFLSNKRNITLDGSRYYNPSDISMGREVAGNTIKAQAQSWGLTEYNLLCKSSRNTIHLIDWDTHTMNGDRKSIIIEGESNSLDVFCDYTKVEDKTGLNAIQFLFDAYKTKPSYQTLPEGTDFNNCKKLGKFSLFSISSYLNSPSGIGSYGTLNVSYAAGSSVIIQKIETVNSLKTLIRSSSDGISWTEWGEYAKVKNPNFAGTFTAGCPPTAPDPVNELKNSQITWYIRESDNKLFFAVKYSTGKVKWVNLTVSG
ncbi:MULTISPECIES: hypothetical protein [unclassified Providencia]|uniref:tail fiber/spike domain-containing protein n=2 Tax=Providencia TaxID=586 RepID=UPI00234A5796|nr:MULTISPECIES: hypothetical protein [unclassified Providencia]